MKPADLFWQTEVRISYAGEPSPAIFARPLYDSMIPVRASNALARAGIESFGDLVLCKREYLLSLPFMGERTVRSIEAELAKHGLSLKEI